MVGCLVATRQHLSDSYLGIHILTKIFWCKKCSVTLTVGCKENVLQIFAGIFNIAKHFLYVTKLERFLEASEMELYIISSQKKS